MKLNKAQLKNEKKRMNANMRARDLDNLDEKELKLLLLFKEFILTKGLDKEDVSTIIGLFPITDPAWMAGKKPV